MKPLIAIFSVAVFLAASSTAKEHQVPAPPAAYVIAEIKVTDPAGYKEYVAAISPIVERFHGTYLVRAGKTLHVEGSEPNGRIVVIAFPSFAAAEAFEQAPESLAAGRIRHRTAVSRIFIVEGATP